MYFLLWVGDRNPTLPIFLGGISFVSIVVVLWRIMLITTVFNDNQQVEANITRVFFFRDRGRIECVYEYNGQKFISGNAVMKTRWSKAIKEGDRVVVMVDRNQPKRSFIRDLYVSGK